MRVASNSFTGRLKLVKPLEFQWVFQAHCKSADTAFVILARQTHRGSPRLGLAISVKHAQNAVTRNRIKRVVRESFRHQQALLGSLDFVVTGRKEINKKTNGELRMALDKHWKVLARCKKS